jgi:putative SOS response-associated peptidase YedK
MCGRFACLLPPEALRRLFGITSLPPDVGPRYNVAPGQPVLAVRFNPRAGGRSLDLLRWGLVPHWAKDATRAAALINARGETLADKPAFRQAFARRRCIIPADAFYEWRAGSRPKQPFAIRPTADQPFALAGLWENWQQPDGQWLRTCTIVTTTPNATMAALHHRMPVILETPDVPVWLGEVPAGPEDLQALLRPCQDDRMIAIPVGTGVNDVRRDDPSLLDPLAHDQDDGRLL